MADDLEIAIFTERSKALSVEQSIVARPLEQPSHPRWPIWGVTLGGILMTGPFWGLLGVFMGMARSRAVIETLKAPSPEDLNAGVEFSRNATIAGMGAFAIGAVIITISALSLLRRRTG